jgi:cell division protein FtsB
MVPARGPRARSTRRLFLAGVVIAILIAYIGPVRGYLDQRSELQGYQRALAQMQSRRDHIAHQIRAIDQPAVLEARARELDMVRPGERRFALKGLVRPARQPRKHDEPGFWQRFIQLFT